MKYLYIYSVVVSASSWWGRFGGMLIENRQIRKGKTVGVASPDENLPTTAGRGNRTHDPQVQCFIVDTGPPHQTARPPNQFEVQYQQFRTEEGPKKRGTSTCLVRECRKASFVVAHKLLAILITRNVRLGLQRAIQ